MGPRDDEDTNADDGHWHPDDKDDPGEQENEGAKPGDLEKRG